MTKPKVLMVLHRAQSEPGRVGRWFTQHNYALDLCKVGAGDRLPADVSGYAGVVIYGGPMSVTEAPSIPHLQDELAWIPSVVASGIPLLGICLGAQLIAKAMGGDVASRPDGKVEVGYYPIYPNAQNDGWLDREMTVFQWHGDGITLPAGARCLASSDMFGVQAFELGTSVIGLQFHPEVTRHMWHRWVIRAADRLQCAGAQPRTAQLEDRFLHDPATQNWLDRFLPRWLSLRGQAG